LPEQENAACRLDRQVVAVRHANSPAICQMQSERVRLGGILAEQRRADHNKSDTPGVITTIAPITMRVTATGVFMSVCIVNRRGRVKRSKEADRDANLS